MRETAELETVAFTSEHAASDFRSGAVPLDAFFRTQAGQNQRRNVSRTWVLERPENGGDLPSVIGFYTLTLGAVERQTLPAAIAKKLPGYPAPVIIIGRLAVDERARGRRMGEWLLVDAHARALQITDNAGGIGVIVDAKDDGAVSFYRRYGYELLEHADEREWPKRMFLPIQTIRAAFET